MRKFKRVIISLMVTLILFMSTDWTSFTSYAITGGENYGVEHPMGRAPFWDYDDAVVITPVIIPGEGSVIDYKEAARSLHDSSRFLEYDTAETSARKLKEGLTFASVAEGLSTYQIIDGQYGVNKGGSVEYAKNVLFCPPAFSGNDSTYATLINDAIAGARNLVNLTKNMTVQERLWALQTTDPAALGTVAKGFVCAAKSEYFTWPEEPEMQDIAFEVLLNLLYIYNPSEYGDEYDTYMLNGNADGSDAYVAMVGTVLVSHRCCHVGFTIPGWTFAVTEGWNEDVWYTCGINYFDKAQGEMYKERALKAIINGVNGNRGEGGGCQGWNKNILNFPIHGNQTLESFHASHESDWPQGARDYIRNMITTVWSNSSSLGCRVDGQNQDHGVGYCGWDSAHGYGSDCTKIGVVHQVYGAITELGLNAGVLGRFFILGSLDKEKSGFKIKVTPDNMYADMTSQVETKGEITFEDKSVFAALKEDEPIKLRLEIKECTASSVNAHSNNQIQLVNIPGLSGSGNVFEGTIDFATAKSLLTDEMKGEFTDMVTPTANAKTTGEMKVYYDAVATWTLGTKEYKCTAYAPTCDKSSTGLTVHDDASWITVGNVDEQIWWEFHSEPQPKVYAQIKANECKNEDWEALAGIPTTENLFVATGGDLFQADVCGTFEKQDNVTRTITFDIDFQNCYFTTAPCTISSGSHTKTHTGESLNSPGASGTFDGPGADGPKLTCACCGASGQGKGGAAGKKAVGKEGEPGYQAEVAPGAGSSWTHQCTYTVSYDCSTGTGSGSGSATVSEKVTKSLVDNRIYIGNNTGTCKCGATFTAECTNSALICEGYTNGKGCSHSAAKNHQHVETINKKWTIEEKFNTIAYINLKKYSIYGLYKFDVVEADLAQGGENSFFSSNPVNQSTGIEIGVEAWDLPDVGKKANYLSGNGRMYFTMFTAQKTFKQGAGWHSTTVTLTPASRVQTDSTQYFLGDCTVKMICEGDNTGGGSTVSASDWSGYKSYNLQRAVRKGGGKTDSNFEAHSSGRNDWQGGKFTIGDLVDDASLNRQGAAMINAWMGANGGAGSMHTAVVVSDQLAVKTKTKAGWTGQDLVGSVHRQAVAQPIFSTFAEASPGLIKSYNFDPLHAGYTESDLFYNKTQDNYRDVYAASDIMRYGWYGQTGHSSFNDSYYLENATGTRVVPLEQLGPSSLLTSTGIVAAHNSITTADITTGDTHGSSDKSPGAYSNDFYRYNYTISETSAPATGGSTFEGWYNEYTYEGQVGSSLTGTLLCGETLQSVGVSRQAKPGTLSAGASLTNSPGANKSAYGFSTLMHNAFKMKNYGPENGAYSDVVKVKAYFTKMIDKSEGTVNPPDWSQKTDRDALDELSKVDPTTGKVMGYQAGFSGTGSSINQVVIHDPVSTEHWFVISQDEYDPGDDDRFNTLPDGNPNKADYWTIGNEIFIFVTDMGEFVDGGGSYGGGGPTNSRGVGNGGYAQPATVNQFALDYGLMCSAYKTNLAMGNGSYAINHGFVDRMYTTNWIANRFVKFPFAVTYYGRDGGTYTAGANQWIALSEVCRLSDYRNGLSNIDVGNTAYAGSLADPDNGVYYSGWYYGFKMASSASEVAGGRVEFSAVAMNNPAVTVKSGLGDNQSCLTNGKGTKIMNSSAFDGALPNNEQRSGLKAKHSTDKIDYIDIVGRIGNLTVSDSTDFRYSELFKQASSTWEIEGTIHKVDITKPRKIASTEETIWNTVAPKQSDAGVKTNGHSSLSTTFDYSKTVSGNLVKVGKASSEFIILPLTPSDQENVNLKSDLGKMGYNLLMDIETMGNYYGVNNYTAYDGTESTYEMLDGTPITFLNGIEKPLEEDNDVATRSKKVTIDAYYWLLDLETGEYIPIDVYFGNEGNRTLCYAWNKNIQSDFRQYIEYPNEVLRRNITEAELYATKKMRSLYQTDMWLFPEMFERDYLGDANTIVLDQKNRTFIGSSIINGAVYKSKESGDWVGYSTAKNDYTETDTLIGKNTEVFDQNVRNNYSIDWNGDGDGYGTAEQEFQKQAQRWHFTLGLPSTSFIVPAKSAFKWDDSTNGLVLHNYLNDYLTGSDYMNTDGTYRQLTIEGAHDALLADHPKSVVVGAIDIKAYGNVWTLHYNGETDAEDGFVVYDDEATEIPAGVTPGRKYPKPKGYERFPIIAVYDPEITSATDLMMKGTH